MTHTHTHTHTHTRTHTHRGTHIHAFPHTHYASYSHPPFLPPSLTPSPSPSLILPLFLILPPSSLSLTDHHNEEDEHRDLENSSMEETSNNNTFCDSVFGLVRGVILDLNLTTEECLEHGHNQMHNITTPSSEVTAAQGTCRYKDVRVVL